MSRLDPLVARARHLVEPHLQSGDVIAVSGGADSLALAAVTSFFVRRRDFAVRAVVVDHGLQSGSADVAARAARQCESLGLPATVRTVTVDDLGTGPEAAARTARYGALLDEAGEGNVLVAHTLDDQAETVLLGLGRGSGPRAISGMRATNDRLRRPFLALRRADTERICALYDLEWWRDPHNEDRAHRRVRVRHELLPLMEEVLGGGVAQALARTADLVRMDTDALEALVAEAMPASGRIDDLRTFAELDAAVRLRVWRRLAIDAGASAGELSHAHTLALDGLLTAAGGTCIQLPGHVAATRHGSQVEFSRTQ